MHTYIIWLSTGTLSTRVFWYVYVCRYACICRTMTCFCKQTIQKHEYTHHFVATHMHYFVMHHFVVHYFVVHHFVAKHECMHHFVASYWEGRKRFAICNKFATRNTCAYTCILYIYIYIYIGVHTCMCVYYTYTYTYIHMYVYKHTHVYVNIHRLHA
jgi:hypothetical protein